MSAPPTSASPPPKRRGLIRLRHAIQDALSGLRLAWDESAFRQEAAVTIVAVPVSCWLGRNWAQVALLLGSLLLLLIVELLNTGIESCIDRIGPEWHALSKRAKDLGSAAVLLTILLSGSIWLAAFISRFF